MKRPSQTIVRREARPISASRSLVSPIYPSVAYASESPDMLDSQYLGEVEGYTYAREGHPNATILAEKIDLLEGATGGLITGSGMAAITALFMGMLSAGDHVLGGNQLYGRSLRLMKIDLPRFGIETDLSDPTDANAFLAAIKPNTRMILLEVVSNPTLRVADISAITKGAHERGILVAIDNTFTTPFGYRPLDHDADFVIHSVTKLLSGHSDTTLGYIAARDTDHRRALYDFIVTTGMTPSPFDCWLAERGLQTFDIRYQRAAANARLLADALAENEQVETVIYPTRIDHPDHNRAVALLQGEGGHMVSFRIAGGREVANRLVKAAPKIAFAPTLGDIGTTLSHPASSSHRGMTDGERKALGIPEGFFRVSVGVEPIDILIDEFATAINAATNG